MSTRPGAAFIASVLLTTLANVAGADSPAQRITLKGISSLKVLIDVNVGEEILSASKLRTDVELKLRETGIRVVEADGPDAFLYLNVALFQVRRSDTDREVGYAYTVQLELLQDVLVKRTSTLILTRTWNSHGTVGFSPPDRLAIQVRGSVREKVDEFLNAYLATNPKKNPKTR